MIKIDLLKNHPYAIPAIANIWHEVLGKIWMPEIAIEEIEYWYYEELNENMPLAYIALNDQIPVGTCSLQLNDGIRPDLKPWLGDLVVDPKYQNQGIGKMLIDAAIKKASELGFEKLYLFTFDPTVSNYYQRLGWKEIGMDEFKSKPVTVMEVELV
jgi:GNAT superfamily N-acetyltransferase